MIFGGISSTYYADQLIQYPFIDMVMRGYDTHKPMASLLEAIKWGDDLGAIPNLVWKSRDEQIRDNGFSYKPDTYGHGIDWSDQPQEATTQTLPILECLSTHNAGCSNDCGWCGGSSKAFQGIFNRECSLVRKPLSEISYEFDTINKLPGVAQYHFYTVGSYNESEERMEFFLDRVSESHFKSISYEQYHLTPYDLVKRMVQANKRTIITLSPTSHDLKVARLAGCGVFKNEELEGWLEKVMDYGIYQVDVWYMIGMPEQDEKSVMETVDYCLRLLDKFKGKRVNPIVCPMIPFLDPASTFFEYPDKHGYRVFYRTVKEHCRGMERASIVNRINYETKWLNRSDLVYVGYKAVRRLMEAKAEVGFLPLSWVKDYTAKIDDALDLIGVVHEADCLADEKERAQELEKLGDEILRRNDMIFFSGVMNQVFPVNRRIGGRWFDELGWESWLLEAAAERARGTYVIRANEGEKLSDLELAV